MNDLPVLRLTQLLTPEEIKIIQGVKRTLERLLIKEPIIMSTWKEHLLRFIPCTSNLT